MQYQTLNVHKSVNQFEKVTKPKPCDKLKILPNTPITQMVYLGLWKWEIIFLSWAVIAPQGEDGEELKYDK